MKKTIENILSIFETKPIQIRIAKVISNISGYINYMNRTGKDPE